MRRWLEDLRDSGIASDNALLKEAQELASIFAVSVRTGRKNEGIRNFVCGA